MHDATADHGNPDLFSAPSSSSRSITTRVVLTVKLLDYDGDEIPDPPGWISWLLCLCKGIRAEGADQRRLRPGEGRGSASVRSV